MSSIIHRTVSWSRRHPIFRTTLATLVTFGLTVFVLYQSEQIAFRRAQLTNPGLPRQPGERAAAAQGWRQICASVPALGAIVQAWWSPRSIRMKREGKRGALFGYHPTGPGFRAVAAFFGVFNIACAIAATRFFVQAFVWEGVRVTQGLYDSLLVLCTGWIGVWLFYVVVQDYRLSALGLPKAS